MVNGGSGVVSPRINADGAIMNGEHGTTTGASRAEMAPKGLKPGSVDQPKMKWLRDQLMRSR